ncbi:lipoprotein signal peptidase [gut metagenome]|uniref:Lipoprotein signal peptidase n=1 Tax=gut metagenome TaxID=749906 RepID=J9G101_9ZZZZ
MQSHPIRNRAILAFATVFSVLIIDQIIKFLVKTRMLLHERIDVTSWFQICFVENEGMAFGMDFVGTSILTVFRIVAVVVFAYILVKIIRNRYPVGLIFCLSLVLAGAAGNIIDNCFYGLIFEASPVDSFFSAPARLVPFGEGYGEFLSGRVVDMFYFPLFEWPESLPIIGGDVFFGAIFNFADAAISCGAVALLLFYSSYLSGSSSTDDEAEKEEKQSAS